MKREQKRSLILTSLTAVLLLVIYIMIPTENGKGQKDNLIIYTMEAGDVTGLDFGTGIEQISLIRKDGRWVYAGDETFPLNQNFVDSMLAKTAQLTARRYVAEGREHYGEYGLEQPSNTILVTGKNEEKKIYLGDSNSATGDCYMAVEGDAKIYTVDATFSNLFSNKLNAMAMRESLPDIRLENMTEVTVSKDGKEISFVWDSAAGQENGGWLVKEGRKPALTADRGLVSECLGKLMKLRYEEMTVYNPSAVKLEEYGLSDRESGNVGWLRVSYQTGDNAVNMEYILRIGKESGDRRYLYVYPENGQGIYTIKKDSLEPFMRLVPEDFLSLDVSPVKADSLSGLILTWDDKSAVFGITRQSSGQKPIYTLNGEEISEADFNAFYYPLYGLAAEKRVSDIAGQLTEHAVLTIVYERIGEPDRIVELIPYDQNYYGAKVDGQTFLLVSRQRVNSLMDEVNKLPAS